MSKNLFTVINPLVKALLRSPLHGLMSRNTLLVEFRGQKSGKLYSTPVSYQDKDGEIRCFTDKSNRWWRNLRSGAAVELTLRGRRVPGTPRVAEDGGPSVREALSEFLIAVPRDAAHAGVRLDDAGRPHPADVEAAADRLVLITIAT